MSRSESDSIFQLHTSLKWNHEIWSEIKPVYEDSFPEHIRKPERIIRNMLQHMDAFLHVGHIEGQPCSMALTGLSTDKRLLIIDYMAVSPEQRSQGIGQQTIAALATWARETHHVDGLLIEAEADDRPEGVHRLRFWLHCGFESTDYIHSYRWIPEKYRAMTMDLQSEHQRLAHPLSRDGRVLFQQIEAFHKQSYARRS
ncbi:N-acetyltransferase [Saccharibacillus sp. JS10]|uniref:GNAT family N-acetyltransferase n=1 Tax=Saccharibacillus sp. JS10 TaxID=2950552 RepID=UPI00210DA7DC|nr:GNAT family N-acetyltransferase [Saccharibacillus sp. JS10]MCQ4085292.1 GNAT family N-acetyltransferase [Saccharibacillus sp. JS10]